MNIAKSAGAVVAGFLTVVLLSIGTDLVLQRVGFFPPQQNAGDYQWWMLGIALLYRCAYTIAGGYITALLAPSKPMRLVWVLAGIGVVGGTIGVVNGWGLSAHWYPIAILLFAVPGVWFGGVLRLSQQISKQEVN